MEKLIKDKILFLILPFAVLIVIILLAFSGPEVTSIPNAISKVDELATKQNELETKKEKVEQLKKAKMSENVEKKKESKSGKVIYEVLGQQFSPEASFGIMFENLLANISNSGIRIRSIEYNYQPDDDKILITNLPNYNACELYFVTVGNYSQFQTFFKNIAKENYLSNIYEIYIEPYDKDKTILITKFKIRLYTKTI